MTSYKNIGGFVMKKAIQKIIVPVVGTALAMAVAVSLNTKTFVTTSTSASTCSYPINVVIVHK